MAFTTANSFSSDEAQGSISERLEALGVTPRRIVLVPGYLLNRWNDFADVYHEPEPTHRMEIVAVNTGVSINYYDKGRLYEGRVDYIVFAPNFIEAVENRTIIFDDAQDGD